MNEQDRMEATGNYILRGRIGELAAEGKPMSAEEVQAQARLLGLLPRHLITGRVHVDLTSRGHAEIRVGHHHVRLTPEERDTAVQGLAENHTVELRP